MLRQLISLTDMGKMVKAVATKGSDAIRDTRRPIFEKISKAVWAKTPVGDKVSPFDTLVNFNSTDEPYLNTCEPYFKAIKEALKAVRKDAGAQDAGFSEEQLEQLPALAMLIRTSAPEFLTYAGRKNGTAGEDKTVKTLSVELSMHWKYQLEHLAPFYTSSVFKIIRSAAAKHLSAIGACLSGGREGRLVRMWSYWDSGLEKVYEQQARPLPVSASVLDLDLDMFLETATMRSTFTKEIANIIKTVTSTKVAQFDSQQDADEGASARKKPVLDRDVYEALEYFVDVSARSECVGNMY